MFQGGNHNHVCFDILGVLLPILFIIGPLLYSAFRMYNAVLYILYQYIYGYASDKLFRAYVRKEGDRHSSSY